MSQVLYGLLSAPFFLFTLPGLQRVLTHAMPTGYDRRGRCRKYCTDSCLLRSSSSLFLASNAS